MVKFTTLVKDNTKLMVMQGDKIGVQEQIGRLHCTVLTYNICKIQNEDMAVALLRLPTLCIQLCFDDLIDRPNLKGVINL